MGQWNYEALRFWLLFVYGLGTLGSGIYLWWLGRTTATRASIEAINARVSEVQEESRQAANDLRKDIEKLELQMEGLPDHEDLAKVYERITSVDGHVQQLVGSVKGLERGVDLIHSHLLNKDR